MRVLAVGGMAAALMVAGAAQAATYVVQAAGNSSSGGGVGLATLSLTAGDAFSVSAGLDDLWSAGALPRWSNADGLTGDRFATGSDESGEAAGVKIGQAFTLWTQHGLTAPYGSLVGEIAGDFRLLGTSFSGPAWASGTLNLYYWDENSSDNVGSVTVAVNAGVPEPATWAMLIAGFGFTGTTLRIQKRRVA